jgi:23S rRNA pseudouridine1911/1915/1917 synthase
MTFEADSGDRGKRLDVFVHERLSGTSRARVQDWIKSGRVMVNGAVQKASYALRGSERIEVEPVQSPPLNAAPEDLPVEVLYQDRSVIAVNKPAGLVVHAGAGAHSGTLVNRLVHHFQTLSSVGGDLRPGIVHRLDRYTSGVLLVARNDSAHQMLAEQFSSRSVEKIYLALVHGAPASDRGRITLRITRDPVRRTRMTTRSGQGRTALTDWEVIERLPGFTFLRVRIGTGRTHQIRVHLSSLGFPVAGDRMYGAPARVEGLLPLERYFLHAHRIVFTSPATGERVAVEAPLAAELEEWLEGLRNRAGAQGKGR